ncbi:MAG: glycosyl hydrolase family 18 protein [Velocimicrobium sp.]
MDETKNKIKAAFFLIIPVIFIIIIAVIAKKFMPSKERIELTDYYPVKGDELLLVLQDQLSESKGLYLDGIAYVDIDTVATSFNKRFYWDANENIVIYTTASEVIKAEVGNKDYYVNKSKTEVDYPIVKVVDNVPYIAVDYMELFSNVTSTIYKDPNRIVFTYKWGNGESAAKVKKTTVLRETADIKSPIVYDVKKGEQVIYIKESEKETSNRFQKVITKDGVIGYIQNKRLKESYPLELKSDFQEETYPSISKDYKINMVWHQVTNQDANNALLNLLDATKGVNTIAPTWFSLANNKGEIVSLASDTYVNRAHSAGVEVWALCDDFDKKNVDTYKLLSYTSRREKLENELIASAIKHNLDGLNIDFENIASKTAPHFIQFIRELSVKCRSNGIVLSIDNYAPGYTGYYDREEQGIVADYVITMAYDEHNGSSEESGSVSSIGYFTDAITNTLKEVPPEKTIIGIPFYTRLWKEVVDGEAVKITSEAYGMTNGANVLTDNGVTPYWDDTTGQNYGEFEANGATYRMWLEDPASIELKMKAVDEAKAGGIACWKLGLESASTWDVIIKYVN